MARPSADIHDLRNVFVAAGLDPAGLDLEFLVYLKSELEARIAAHRADEAFDGAPPAFGPPVSE